MDLRDKEKLFSRIDEVEIVSKECVTLIQKLIQLQKEYATMLEEDEYPKKEKVKKIQASIKKVEKSLRISGNKFGYSYDRLIKEEYKEKSKIKICKHEARILREEL